MGRYSVKPSTSDGYDPATTLQAKATCLYVATKLGDLMDEIVVVGGLVPSLLVPQDVGCIWTPISARWMSTWH